MNERELLNYEKAQKISQLKFALIAPVVSGTFNDASQNDYFKRVSKLEIEWIDGTKKKFSFETIRGWYYRYIHGGIDALAPLARLDSGRSRRLSDEQKNYIVDKIKEFPKITGVFVYEMMIKDGIATKKDLSVDTVQRFIRNSNIRNGASLPKKERRTWEFESSCDGYEADTCHTFYIFDKNGEYRKTYLIAMIDNHSRMIVGAEFFFNDNAVNFQKVWKSAVSRYGRSRVLILDNGSSYKNKSTGMISTKLGTHLIYNPPFSPQGKALQERFFRTIKDRWLNADHGSNYHSLEELNEKLKTWIAQYNRTPHRALEKDANDNHTPLQRYMFDMKDVEPCMTANKRADEYDGWVDECFLHEETRKVNGDSTVLINNILFDVPSVYIGSKVIVRYEPRDYSVVYLYDPINKKKIELKQTDRVENGRTRREEIIY